MNDANTLNELRRSVQALTASIFELKSSLADELRHFASVYAPGAPAQRELTKLIQRLHNVRPAEKEALLHDLVSFVNTLANSFDSEAVNKHKNIMQAAQKFAERRFENARQVAISCKQLRKSFGRKFRFRGPDCDFSLGPIDFELRRGEIAGVVGENSNGKTTFFRLLAGELARDAGELSYPFLQEGGAKIDWNNVKRNIAYVPQDIPRYYGSLRSHLEYEAAVHGVRGVENKSAVDYIVERLRLTDHIKKSWAKLSGGYKFRFALARALVWRPSLLILDEPLANLDPKAQLVVLQDIQQMAKNLAHPMAVLISSQHIMEIEAVSDKLIYLQDGRPRFNDYKQFLGKTRKSNVFLLNVAVPYETLRGLYPASMNLNIAHDGVNYVMTTGLEINQSDILQPLVRKAVSVRAFEDISNSTMRMFEEAS